VAAADPRARHPARQLSDWPARWRAFWPRLAAIPSRFGSRRRSASVAAWNAKVLGSHIAHTFYGVGLAGPAAKLPEQPQRIGLASRLCRQADIESDWLRHWCRELRFVPMYHRKVWEDCFALQALWEAGLLEPGKRGLGFAVGAEFLPSFFAARGIEVVASDLDAQDRRARGWIRTAQHGTTMAELHKPNLVDEARFREHVTLQSVDMNAIPAELEGGFDFCWSVCAFEHCGTIARGLDFVRAAMRTLKPGGVAVHTTEFNLDAHGPTPGAGATVLFQRRHIEALRASLAAEGHEMLEPDFDPGHGIFDGFVDMPPFLDATTALRQGAPPHLRVAHLGYVTTSIGLVIRKAG
jgi:SAM-dependent methyltransferase